MMAQRLLEQNLEVDLPSTAAMIGPGRLHLRLEGHARAVRLARRLPRRRWSWDDGASALTLEVPESDLTDLALVLSAALTVAEQQTARALFERRGVPLHLGDYLAAQPLDSFIAQVLTGWLVHTARYDALDMVFQPIFSTGHSAIHGYEALLRVSYEGITLAPANLLHAASHSGLAGMLDLAARRCALQQAAAAGVREKIFLNLLPGAICDKHYGLRQTLATLQDCGLQRQQIVLEITESEAIHDVAEVCRELESYRRQGLAVALDDLGSGYSSLNLLLQLRPDYVKLDRALMHGVAADPYLALITEKLLETARVLGIPSIAEGVEDQADYEWLCSHGADYVQGYYMGLPAPLPRSVESVPQSAIAPLTRRLAAA